MNDAVMEWKRDSRKYSSGEYLYLGRWHVGGAHYSAMVSEEDPLTYSATCNLPGIKPRLGFFGTVEEAKADVERVVKYWLSKITEVGAQDGMEA